jgi:hypothetical protein
MYTYLYICLYKYVYTSICIYMYIYAHVCMYRNMYTYVLNHVTVIVVSDCITTSYHSSLLSSIDCQSYFSLKNMYIDDGRENIFIMMLRGRISFTMIGRSHDHLTSLLYTYVYMYI